MKKLFQKIKPRFKKFSKYFFDFLVVFIGVFLAFWLNARKEEQNKIEQETQIFSAIYEDINEFYIYGRVENPNGFINVFKSNKSSLDSLAAIKKIPTYIKFYGDYWHLEIINSFIESGQLKDMDPKLLKGLAKFNTVHKMFLAEIEDFNKEYEAYITTQ